MRRIRSVNTKPEMAVRKAAFGLGFRYRLHEKHLPGRPDLVFPSKRKVIFVNGCFWHQHARCHLQSMPSRNLTYWMSKFERTKVRDRKNRIDLRRLRWKYPVIWECEIRDGERLESRRLN